MKAHVKLSSKLEDVEATIEITMPIKQWREVMRQLPKDWPSWTLGNLLSSVLGEIARKTSFLVEEGADVEN